MRKNNYSIFKMLMVIFLLLSFLFFQQPSFGFAQNQNDETVDNARPIAVPGEYLVKFKELPEGEIGTLSIGASSLLEKEKTLFGTDISLMSVRNDIVMTLSETDFLEELRKDPRVEYAEPNYYLYPMSMVPNDPRFNDLWGLHNTVTPGVDINILEAWEITLGAPEIIVAVSDSGTNVQHEDLSANIAPGYKNFIGTGTQPPGEPSEDIYDPEHDKHGTHVSGTIVAVRNNNKGVAGVAPESKVLPLKFINQETGVGTLSDATEAINYAKEMGIKISNNSWGGNFEQLPDFFREVIEESGMLFVAAAGNEGINNDLSGPQETYEGKTVPGPTYPASFNSPNILSVAAIDINGELANFSNYGANTVHVAAPGKSILSTFQDGYAKSSGTSMATPHVSGVAALMYTLEPSLTPEEAIDIIMSTGKPLESLEGKTISGKLVDANAALLEVLDRSTSLSDIGLSEGILYPDFDCDINDYTVLVESDADEIEITANLNYDSSILKINGELHNNGEPKQIELNQTINTVEIEVSSDNHPIAKTYTIDVLKGLGIIDNNFIVYPLSFTDVYGEPFIMPSGKVRSELKLISEIIHKK